MWAPARGFLQSPALDRDGLARHKAAVSERGMKRLKKIPRLNTLRRCRTGGRVVEGTGLENRHTGEPGIESSNLSLSVVVMRAALLTRSNAGSRRNTML